MGRTHIMHNKTKGRRATWIPVGISTRYLREARAQSHMGRATHYWKHGQQLAEWVGH